MDQINKILTNQQLIEQPISEIVLNLILCMLLVSLISWYYKKFSQSLGGKTHIGSVLPLKWNELMVSFDLKDKLI